MTGFREKYGPWALVAGASEGLGAAFAHDLAGRGLNLILVARRAQVLSDLATELRSAYAVEVRTAAIDLGGDQVAAAVGEAVNGVEVGLLVYNAAAAPVGRFFDLPLEDKLRAVDVNCRGPVVLADLVGRPMVERRRGGIVLMSSLAGFFGTAMVATYAASKAFNTVLGEGLWDELRRGGVDVLVCCAGATRTPNFTRSQPRQSGRTLEPAAVVTDALAALGKGPLSVPGRSNRVADWVLRHLFGRRLAVRTMGSATRKMYERTPRTP